MKKLTVFLLVIVALLSCAAGIAKIMRVPEELEFLQQFGFSDLAIIVFGIVQLLSGILLLITKTRLIGALTALLAFALSAGLVFASGNIPFALFSLLPVVATAFISYQFRPSQQAPRQ